MLNGIVLASFLNDLRAQGYSPREAVRQGSSMRLRPVPMTATAAILGLVPMLLSSGVGAETNDRWPPPSLSAACYLNRADAPAATCLRVDRGSKRKKATLPCPPRHRQEITHERDQSLCITNRIADVISACGGSGLIETTQAHGAPTST